MILDDATEEGKYYEVCLFWLCGVARCCIAKHLGNSFLIAFLEKASRENCFLGHDLTPCGGG